MKLVKIAFLLFGLSSISFGQVNKLQTNVSGVLTTDTGKTPNVTLPSGATLTVASGGTLALSGNTTANGATITPTEFSYLDGVTANIVTLFAAKADLASPTFSGTVTAPTISGGGLLSLYGTGGVSISDGSVDSSITIESATNDIDIKSRDFEITATGVFGFTTSSADAFLFSAPSGDFQVDVGLSASITAQDITLSSSGSVFVNPGTPTTEAKGLWFGTDTAIYRSAADTIRTQDALIVSQQIKGEGETSSAAGLATIQAKSNGPSLELWENDAAGDSKRWGFLANTGVLTLQTKSDDGSSVSSWMQVARSGASPTTVTIPMTTAAANTTSGALVVTGGVGINGTLHPAAIAMPTAGYLDLPETAQTTEGRIWYASNRVKYRDGVGGDRILVTEDISQTLTNKTLGSPVITGTITIPDGALAIADTNGLESALNDKNTGNRVWVDSVNGVDATGIRGRSDKPFLTVQAAITAASSGDTVHVGPGTYTGTITLKNGVNIACAPGVTFLQTFPEGLSSGHAHITDGGVAVTCSLVGRPDLILTAAGAGNAAGTGNYAFQLSAASTVTAELRNSTVSALVTGVANFQIANSAATLYLRADRVTNATYDGVWVYDGAVFADIIYAECGDNVLEFAPMSSTNNVQSHLRIGYGVSTHVSGSAPGIYISDGGGGSGVQVVIEGNFKARASGVEFSGLGSPGGKYILRNFRMDTREADPYTSSYYPGINGGGYSGPIIVLENATLLCDTSVSSVMGSVICYNAVATTAPDAGATLLVGTVANGRFLVSTDAQ